MRKGQTAIEYLMTYGWAILIILIVAGVLAYYGVFAPQSLLGPSISGFSSIAVITPWDLDSAGNLRVLLENRVGQEIKVFNIYGDTDSEVGYAAASFTNQTIPAGSQTSNFVNADFTAALSGSSQASYKLWVKVEYELTGKPGEYFNVSGTLSGQRS